MDQSEWEKMIHWRHSNTRFAKELRRVHHSLERCQSNTTTFALVDVAKLRPLTQGNARQIPHVRLQIACRRCNLLDTLGWTWTTSRLPRLVGWHDQFRGISRNEMTSRRRVDVVHRLLCLLLGVTCLVKSLMTSHVQSSMLCVFLDGSDHPGTRYTLIFCSRIEESSSWLHTIEW